MSYPCTGCRSLRIMMIMVVLISVIVTLTACTSQSPAKIPDAKLPTFHPPMVAPVELEKVRWTIITKDRAALLTDDSAYVALSWDEYLKLSANMAAITSYLKSQNAVICYYRVELREKRCVVPLTNPQESSK